MEAQLGDLESARRDADTLLALTQREKDDGMVMEAELVLADVFLRSRKPEKAQEMAQAANWYAASKGQRESEWQSLLYLASAMRDLGYKPASVVEAQKAIAILDELRVNWGDQAYHQYISRPDNQLALHLSGVKNPN